MRLGLDPRFSGDFDIGQSFFEVFTDHFVHAHHDREKFGDENKFPRHRPRHFGLSALRNEGKLNRIGAREGPEKFDFQSDQVVGMAFEDRHFAGAHLFIAIPSERRPGTGGCAPESIFSVWVHLFPRRPDLPVVKVIHQREDRRCWRVDPHAPGDSKVVRFSGENDGEYNHHQSNYTEKGNEHTEKFLGESLI